MTRSLYRPHNSRRASEKSDVSTSARRLSIREKETCDLHNRASKALQKSHVLQQQRGEILVELDVNDGTVGVSQASLPDHQHLGQP